MIPYREIRRLVHREMHRRGWEPQGDGDPAAFRHAAPGGEGAVVVNIGRLWRQVSKRQARRVQKTVQEQVVEAIGAVLEVARVPWSHASECLWLVLAAPGTGAGAEITATNVVPEPILSAFTVHVVIPRRREGSVPDAPWPYRAVTVVERECWAVDDRRIFDVAGLNMGGGELELEAYRDGMFVVRSLPGQPPVSSLIMWPGCLLRVANVGAGTPALVSVLPDGMRVCLLLGDADAPARIARFREFCVAVGAQGAPTGAGLPWRIWWVDGSRIFALPTGMEGAGV